MMKIHATLKESNPLKATIQYDAVPGYIDLSNYPTKQEVNEAMASLAKQATEAFTAGSKVVEQAAVASANAYTNIQVGKCLEAAKKYADEKVEYVLGILTKRVGTYAVQDLVQGITCGLSIQLEYPVAVDSYELVVDDTPVGERTAIGSVMRIAKELLNSSKMKIAFYQDDTVVYTTKILQTIANAGMLLVED